MKNFKNYDAEKYLGTGFQKIEDGIYLTKCPYDDDDIYVTSLSFEMEPDSYGEDGASPRDITQIPFEGILDKFHVWVTDFYDVLNETSETLCYQEFGSDNLSYIQNLRTIIGKRFYAVPFMDEVGDECYNEVME